MAILCFSDVLQKVGINPSKVKLIRHSLSSEEFRPCYEKNMILEYTCTQKKGFAKGFDYWAIFLSDRGTQAKFYALYKVNGSVLATNDIMPEGFPHTDWFQSGESAYFDLKHIDLLQGYENKLIIDWGRATQAWHQNAILEKPIISIQAAEMKTFSGFEDLVLTYDELKKIVDNPTIYDSWHTALSSVYAIYLIVDSKSGQQYVGSAYGKNGLLGRWTEYVTTHHGGNKRMKELLREEPERYHHFQFSILQILPKTVTNEDAIHLESLYKKKLLTIPFGMNDN